MNKLTKYTKFWGGNFILTNWSCNKISGFVGLTDSWWCLRKCSIGTCPQPLKYILRLCMLFLV